MEPRDHGLEYEEDVCPHPRLTRPCAAWRRESRQLPRSIGEITTRSGRHQTSGEAGEAKSSSAFCYKASVRVGHNRDPPMRVLNYEEAAGRMGIVRRSLERLIANGEGPNVVFLSQRRRGILEADFEEWLLSRRRPRSLSTKNPFPTYPNGPAISGRSPTASR